MTLIVEHVPLAALVVLALGAAMVHALAKGLLVCGYLWGRLGAGQTVRALGRIGPPLGGGSKIWADFDLFCLTGLLLYLTLRLADRMNAWELTLAKQWARGFWDKTWLTPAAVCAVAIVAVKLLDLAITLFSMKALEADVLGEAPAVRKRQILVVGIEFVLWRLFGWLARGALVLGRLIPGTGMVRLVLRRAAEASSLPPNEFYQRFYREIGDPSRRKRLWASADYLARFLAIRGFTVLFFALSLL